MECAVCRKKEPSKTRCVNGHYVCNDCHTQGMDTIFGVCLAKTSADPIAIVRRMMDLPFCHMHGPEHHVMVGAALLTAYKNAGGRLDLEAALREMYSRGKEVPGGVCGFWGACGAGISAGQFLAIATASTPLAAEPWGLRPDDRPGSGAHRRRGRSPVLQARLLPGDPGRRGLRPGAPGGGDGADCSRLLLQREKRSVHRQTLSLLSGQRPGPPDMGREDGLGIKTDRAAPTLHGTAPSDLFSKKPPADQATRHTGCWFFRCGRKAVISAGSVPWTCLWPVRPPACPDTGSPASGDPESPPPGRRTPSR